MPAMANSIWPAWHSMPSSISLADEAYEMLMRRRLSNELAPGMLINRRELAHELKMSVAPVLEAIIQLQAEGFLESIPRQGTLVRSVNFDNLRGELLLREALECEAARLYCGATALRTMQFMKLATKADASEKKTFVELWNAESVFHSSLIALTKCAPLIDAYKKVMQRKLFASVNLLLSGEAFTGGKHVTVLRELRTHDPDRAEKLIRGHLRFNKERLFSPSFH
jgi:DNA-binding GntR family transcriptional regulator